ncbi:GntT/GntP/DsdX family permease, partial [Neisseria sp. P0016.S005]|uniref:GntT/GntP/DsdX family permease n=1 Tax=Neisseria sp. P0016.S005 TaxID=3436771 RepID=UPI003F7F7519
VLATPAVSVGCIHFNDKGFRLLGRLMNMDVPKNLKTWTLKQTLIALNGDALSTVLYL